MAASTATKSRPSKSASKTPAASPSPSPAPEKKATASKPAKASAKSAPDAVTQMYRRFSKDTSGTYRFEAVDAKGTPLAQDHKDAHATQLYIRKTSKAMSSDPKFLIVTIQEVSELPKGAKPVASSEEDDD